jgi:3-phosphoshikimate 1-carboxyvinyltransferase
VNQKLTPAQALHGTVTVPADKSIAHRALLIAALAEGDSEIAGFAPDAADPRSTLRCLQTLGIHLTPTASKLAVHGRGLHGFHTPNRMLDAGNSGTTIRLITGILAGQPFVSSIGGDESLNRRPMRRIIDPLTEMGARIEASKNLTAPLTIYGRAPLRPLEYRMPVASAQVKSALLFAGLYADGLTRIIEPTPTRDHTERMLGLNVRESPSGKIIEVAGGTVIQPGRFFIPGDLSAAAFIIAAALIVPGSEIRMTNIGLNPTRARVLDIFRSLGGKIEVVDQRIVGAEPEGDLVVRSSTLSGSVDLRGSIVAELIDEIPILAVTAAFAEGSFVVRDASELRVKESDRIRAIVTNLRKLGLDVEEYEDGFAFQTKKPLIGAEFESFGDHRIAMAFGIAGLAVQDGALVRDSECVDISFPRFWETLLSVQES